MATFDLGRVTPLYKGDYSASASYELNDVVLYDGNLYWHVQATATVGILPTDTTVWKLAFADEGVRAEIRGYADDAQTSADSALSSKTAAATSASNASASASQAALSAQSASTKASEASTSAQTANSKASEASTSAQSAASSAQIATDKATLASQKAAAASESASLAIAKANAAATSETNAAASAQTATAKASEAAASATSAQEYDESAQQSAVNAQTAQGLAETAQTAAETAQGLAEDAAESVSSSAAQIATNTADITGLKEDLTQNLSGTRNLNTTGIGRYRSNGTAPEYINNNNYAGMTAKIPCEASTKYTATFYNVGIGTIRASYYASDESYLSEYHASSVTSLTFTTPSNAAYIHVWTYNGSGVSVTDNSHIQVEKGETSTPYIEPFSANDRNARYDVGNLENRVARNISMLSNLLYRNIGTFICHFGTSYNMWDTIPSQSIFDIERAKRLGFKAIELNILTTSDGKFITMHGVGGKFGSAVISLDSSDIENTLVSSVTLDYIKTNVRYKSTLDKYKVTPSTLEEALVACHKFGIIPAIQNISPDAIDIANNILGKNNYILLIYQGDRPTGFDGVCCSWLSINTESDLLAKCNASGGAYIAGFNTTDSAYESFTDDDWISMFKMVHANGYRASSAYLSNPINANRFLKNGLDFFFTGYQIPDIENGNVCNLTNDETWSNFDITGSVSNNIVTLSSGQTIKPIDTFENVFIGGGALHIRFNGSIYISMGHYINSAYTLTSDGTEDVYVSTYFTREAPTFTITATDATTVYNLTYKASEV